MNPLHNNGQLNTDIFTDEINQPIQLTYDQEKQYWHDIFTVIHFGHQRLTDAEFHIENDIAHITANALIAGISLTFDYDDSNNRFESDEKINIIHIVADQIHTLTDFSISQTGEITASLVSEQLIDLTGKNIQLKYNESGDTWYSEQMRTVKYGKCQFDNAHIFLNDYDFFLKGIPPFSDKEIEFNFGKTAQKEIYFHASNVHWQIGDHAFQNADIVFLHPVNWKPVDS
ncbi:MAG: hypothetical protein OMM_04668 [Candidatus Magnetoglobus multicellularis str. Araruama]|uniref:Uncharacterized protein n=1 Tax=Candidatus Magnetoglobus multicellularis str. Araruama TaxID=890399 RepID=A0A1V1P057_9BACT|nr:MAG: hypothetical protein OMM_04668 [Candidatus Magnetoglobus multicellularis str. Araruama]